MTRDYVERTAVSVSVFRLPPSIHMGQPPWGFTLGLQSWWGSQSSPLSSSGKGLDTSQGRPIRCPPWNSNLEENDSGKLTTILLYSSRWCSPEKTSHSLCSLDVMSCSGTCAFPCWVLQIFLWIFELSHTFTPLLFFNKVTQVWFLSPTMKNSLANMEKHRNK